MIQDTIKLLCEAARLARGGHIYSAQLAAQKATNRLKILTEEDIEAMLKAPAKRDEGEPYSLKEFSDKSNLSVSTIRRMIKCGNIRKVEGIHKTLIPSSEIERFA